MQIVKFKDGTYAIRRTSCFGKYEYRDLVSRQEYWWGVDSDNFKDCLIDQPQDLEDNMDYGTPI